MSRDYAARNRRPAARAAGLPGWVWLVAGLSMGLVVAVVIYIGRPTQPMPMAPAAGAAAHATPAKPRPKVDIPPREEPRFDFYTLLEKEQVVIPPSAPAPAAPTRPAPPSVASVPAPVAAPAMSGDGQYLVVAGAFREQANAEQHRANLALAGIESRIEGITGQDGKTWHRVRIGPENSLAGAQSVLARLKAGGFDGRVVKTPQ